jgi:adenylate kinase
MDEEEKPPVVKPPPPYQPVHYFVSSLNTFFAQHLVARLRNDQQHPENPNRIVGTTVSDSKL